MLFALAIAVIAVALLLRQCWNVSPYPAMSESRSISREITPVEKNVELPPVHLEKTNAPATIVWRTRNITVADSAEIKRLSATIDLLRRAMSDAGASVVFSLDTITATHDTIRVDCDETQRRIALALRFAPRTVTVERETITETITQVRRFGFGVSAGYSLYLDNGRVEARPAINLGINYTIF